MGQLNQRRRGPAPVGPHREGKEMAIKLTPEEEWLYMPKWKKALIVLFVVLMPIIGSIEYVG